MSQNISREAINEWKSIAEETMTVLREKDGNHQLVIPSLNDEESHYIHPYPYDFENVMVATLAPIDEMTHLAVLHGEKGTYGAQSEYLKNAKDKRERIIQEIHSIQKIRGMYFKAESSPVDGTTIFMKFDGFNWHLGVKVEPNEGTWAGYSVLIDAYNPTSDMKTLDHVKLLLKKASKVEADNFDSLVNELRFIQGLTFAEMMELEN